MTGLQTLFAASVGLAVTAFLIAILRPLAHRIEWVDRPHGHKTHSGDVPLTGGIAMFCGFLFALLMLDTPLSEYRPLFAGAALLVITGVLDDFKELPAWARFVAQIGAGLIMTLWGGVVVHDLGGLIGGESLPLGVWAVPFTVFGTVGVINALNMADGMDGLAGSLVLVVVALLTLLSAQAGDAPAVPLLLVVAAVVVGFLLFNLRLPGRDRAKVFMGDAGSMFLGYLLAWFLVVLSQKPHSVIAPVTALWLFAIPLVDTVSVMLRRMLKGRSPFSADREHFHHVLLAAGFQVSTSVLVIVVLAIVAAAAGALAQIQNLPESLRFGGFLALFGLYFWGMQHAFRLTRFLGSMRRRF